MKEIHLTQGKVAIVDDEDHETLSSVKWFAQRNGRTFYAERRICIPGGGQKAELMHRLVLERKLDRELFKADQCDHINGDGLDNRRGNLRVSTYAQNNRNCRRHVRNPSSRYLGVSWDKIHENWKTSITINGKQISIGYYETELAAALAREAYIAAHPELHARSNFPNDTALSAVGGDGSPQNQPGSPPPKDR